MNGYPAFRALGLNPGRIVPSYAHMTNNRLGVSITEEAYLAHLIYRTLNAVPAEASESSNAAV